jgi:hypothetical protein
MTKWLCSAGSVLAVEFAGTYGGVRGAEMERSTFVDSRGFSCHLDQASMCYFHPTSVL